MLGGLAIILESVCLSSIHGQIFCRHLLPKYWTDFNETLHTQFTFHFIWSWSEFWIHPHLRELCPWALLLELLASFVDNCQTPKLLNRYWFQCLSYGPVHLGVGFKGVMPIYCLCVSCLNNFIYLQLSIVHRTFDNRYLHDVHNSPFEKKFERVYFWAFINHENCAIIHVHVAIHLWVLMKLWDWKLKPLLPFGNPCDFETTQTPIHTVRALDPSRNRSQIYYCFILRWSTPWDGMRLDCPQRMPL